MNTPIKTQDNLSVSALRQRFERGISPHLPVFETARTRLLRYTGNLLDGFGCMVLASAAGLAHTVGTAHGLNQGWPSWSAAAWLVAYLSAWLMFVAGATQSLAFGIVLLAAYFIAATTGIGGEAVLETLMLLSVTAIAARACIVSLSVVRDIARAL